jgi:hypothetical protein
MFLKYLHWLPNFTKVFTSKTHCIVEEASVNVILQLSNKNKITFLKLLIILPARSSYTSFKSSNFHLFKNNLIYLIIFTFFIIIICNLFIWIFYSTQNIFILLLLRLSLLAALTTTTTTFYNFIPISCLSLRTFCKSKIQKTYM